MDIEEGTAGCGITLTVLFAIFLVVSVIMNMCQDEKNPGNGTSDSDVIVNAEQYVRQNLKAPSTADFS